MVTKPPPNFGCPNGCHRIPAAYPTWSISISPSCSRLVGATDRVRSLRSGQIKEDELKEQSQKFLGELSAASSPADGRRHGTRLEHGARALGRDSPARAPCRDLRHRRRRPSCFHSRGRCSRCCARKSRATRKQLGDEIWTATKLLDKLGLYTAEVYQQSRDDVIRRQAQELLELSTPVVELWHKILALPLIGTWTASARRR